MLGSIDICTMVVGLHTCTIPGGNNNRLTLWHINHDDTTLSYLDADTLVDMPGGIVPVGGGHGGTLGH